jgi:hypothetical protein
MGKGQSATGGSRVVADLPRIPASTGAKQLAFLARGTPQHSCNYSLRRVSSNRTVALG